jgi:hypothetical protein
MINDNIPDEFRACHEAAVKRLKASLRRERDFRASMWKLSSKAPSLRKAILEIEEKLSAPPTITPMETTTP